jgi:CO/xanthine dehydrogenase FAD-binding subunit
VGRRLDRAALDAALEEDFGEARPLAHNEFKIGLARRAAARALELAGGQA